MEIITADITTIDVCAIVNAANGSLLGGGGVDGAIHKAGGINILKECQAIRKSKYQHGLPTGEAVATTAGNLKSKYVIHTVGPVYDPSENRCSKLLENCYKNSLQIAKKLGCDSIAFPSISTGIYGYPKNEAAKIAYSVAKEYLKHNSIKIIFVFFSDDDKEIFLSNTTKI